MYGDNLVLMGRRRGLLRGKITKLDLNKLIFGFVLFDFIFYFNPRFNNCSIEVISRKNSDGRL